jgi:hypothetical protein
MKTATKTKADKRETDVIEGMSNARQIAEKIFGVHVTTDAVHEVFDYLEEADEDEFVDDLTRVADHARKIYDTTAPTSEQVFGLFERIFAE